MERCENSHENFFVNSSPAFNLNFEIHSLEEEATIASPIVHNIL
jgi:hypothetical protein